MIDARSLAMDFSSDENADAFVPHADPLARSEKMMAPKFLMTLIALFILDL
jgi:hypothetical protein